jgi:hypothetical protein
MIELSVVGFLKLKKDKKRSPIVLTLYIIPKGTTDQAVVSDGNPTMFCSFSGEYQRAR